MQPHYELSFQRAISCRERTAPASAAASSGITALSFISSVIQDIKLKTVNSRSDKAVKFHDVWLALEIVRGISYRMPLRPGSSEPISLAKSMVFLL